MRRATENSILSALQTVFSGPGSPLTTRSMILATDGLWGTRFPHPNFACGPWRQYRSPGPIYSVRYCPVHRICAAQPTNGSKSNSPKLLTLSMEYAVHSAVHGSIQ